MVLLCKFYNERFVVPSYEFVFNKMGFEKRRLLVAAKYLDGKNFIKAKFMGDGSFFIVSVEPPAIDMTFNSADEFKRNFGFEVNLWLMKFKWGAEDR